MFYLNQTFIIEESIKKSRFIGVIIPCADETQVLSALKKLSEQYPDATHIAYAYRLKTDNGIIYRFHDAGEPTGTAGKPIFQHLDGKDLINVLVAVIRYFGGIKLGAGGLTRAYSQTAKLVIEAAEILPYTEQATLTLTLDYKQLQSLEYWLKKLDGKIINQEFAGQVKSVVRLPVAHVDALRQSLA
ncbi:MAG: YigZ family protein [Methylococcaceae bacterium]